MDLSSILNHSPDPHIITLQSNQTMSHEAILQSLQCKDGKPGIQCRNTSCSNWLQAPWPGHQECIGFFCKACCAEAACQSYENNKPVVCCNIWSHWMGAGVHNVVVQVVPFSTVGDVVSDSYTLPNAFLAATTICSDATHYCGCCNCHTRPTTSSSQACSSTATWLWQAKYGTYNTSHYATSEDVAECIKRLAGESLDGSSKGDCQ